MAQRGSVRTRSGSWWGSYSSIVVDPGTGDKRVKQHTIKLGPKSMGKITAARALAKHIESTENTSGKHRPDAAVTLESFARSRWLPTREPKWRSFTDASGRTSNPGKDAAEYVMGHIFAGLGKVCLEDIDSVMLQQWVNKMAGKYSGSLVKKCRIYLKSILEWAVWEDYLRKNPAKFLSLPLEWGLGPPGPRAEERAPKRLPNPGYPACAAAPKMPWKIASTTSLHADVRLVAIGRTSTVPMSHNKYYASPLNSPKPVTTSLPRSPQPRGWRCERAWTS